MKWVWNGDPVKLGWVYEVGEDAHYNAPVWFKDKAMQEAYEVMSRRGIECCPTCGRPYAD